MLEQNKKTDGLTDYRNSYSWNFQRNRISRNRERLEADGDTYCEICEIEAKN